MTEEESRLGLSEMPTPEQNDYIKDHQHVSCVDDAHPIDEKIIESVSERPGIDFPLAAIQATADIYIDSLDDATLVEVDGETEYYCVTSDIFSRFAVCVGENYNDYIEVEELKSIVDVHTIQYLSDIHGYEGNFEGRAKTLCNALNDSSVQEGAVRRENEPEDAHYGFADSRGLVVQRGTHT